MNSRLMTIMRRKAPLITNYSKITSNSPLIKNLISMSQLSKNFSSGMATPEGCDDAFKLYPSNFDVLSEEYHEENKENFCLCVTKD